MRIFRKHLALALLVGLACIGQDSRASSVWLSCDIQDVPRTHPPVCQDAPVVFEGQYVIVKGKGFVDQTAWTVGQVYVTSTESKPNKYERVEPVTHRRTFSIHSTFYEGEKLWFPREVQDGSFIAVIRIPERFLASAGMPDNQDRTLYIDLSGPPPKSGGSAPIKTVEVVIRLRKGLPQKEIRQELFECDGPDPTRTRINPLANPNPKLNALCHAGGAFSFVGGPYAEARRGGYGASWLVLRPPGDTNKSNWKSVRPNQFDASTAPNPLPDQIMRYQRGQWFLPTIQELAEHPVWQLSFTNREGFTRDIGLIEVAPPSKAGPPPAPPPKSYSLANVRRGEAPHFLRPDSAKSYQGGKIDADIPADAFICPTSGSCPPGWPIGFTDQANSQRYCAAYLNNRRVSGAIAYGQPGKMHKLSLDVPDDLRPDSYKLSLSCPQVKGSFYYGEMTWERFDAEGGKVDIAAPRAAPDVVLEALAPPPDAGASVRDLNCSPCNGEKYSVEVNQLTKGDTVQLIQWSDGGGWPAGSDILAHNQAVANSSPFKLMAWIPEQADLKDLPLHYLSVKLKDTFDNVYDVPATAIKSKKKAGVYPFNGGWNFHKLCAALKPTQPIKLEKIVTPVDLWTGPRIVASLSNVDCMSEVRAKIAVRALAIEQNLYGQNTGVTRTTDLVDVQFELPSQEDSWLDRVTHEMPAKVTFTSLASGRTITADITLLPRLAIKVLTQPAKAGQSVDIEWRGFPSNQSATLLFDRTPLNNTYPFMLEKGQPITVRLPEGVTGSHTLTLTGAGGKSASATIEIAGNSAPVGKNPPNPSNACDQTPCIQVQPEAAGQGDLITVMFSGFPQNSQVKFTLRDKWLINSGHYQSSAIDSIQYRLPAGLPDGDYAIVAQSIPFPKLTATRTIKIAGKRKTPTLVALPIPLPNNQVSWYRLGMHSIHVQGRYWALGAPFTATLISEDLRIHKLAAPPLNGCLGKILGEYMSNTCNEYEGEIIQFWQFWPLNPTVQPGLYVLQLSDGLSETYTQPFHILPQAPAQAGPKPAPKPDPKPDPAPTPVRPEPVRYCDPYTAAYLQRGCIERETPKPPLKPMPEAPKSVPNAAKYCNPNIPEYNQPGCIAPEKPKQAPATVTRCNPNIPEYNQPGCLP